MTDEDLKNKIAKLIRSNRELSARLAYAERVIKAADEVTDEAWQARVTGTLYLATLRLHNAVKAYRASDTSIIDRLLAAFKWAWKEGTMQFVAPHPGEDHEYDYCRSCSKPEWKHDENCLAMKEKAKVEALLSELDI